MNLIFCVVEGLKYLSQISDFVKIVAVILELFVCTHGRKKRVT